VWFNWYTLWGSWSWDLKQKHEVLKSIRGIGFDPKATTLTGQMAYKRLGS